MSEVITRERCLERIAYWVGMEQRALYSPAADKALQAKHLVAFRERVASWRRRLAALDKLHGEGRMRDAAP